MESSDGNEAVLCETESSMKNRYALSPCGTYAEVQLTQGKVTLVDVADLPLIMNHRWCASTSSSSNTFYACSSKGVKLHRALFRLPSRWPYVDHVNGDGLDNRRRNLRLATPSQNCYNKSSSHGSASKYKGVAWHKKNRRWQVYIKCQDKSNKYIGSFTDEDEAARAYNRAALELHGEYARLNDVPVDNQDEAG